MPDTFNEELGRRIRAARKGKLTQAALGDRVSLSRTAITNIECGRQRLLVDQLVDIAAALGVHASDLLPSIKHEKVVSTGELPMGQMPTVQRWITSVKKSPIRRRA
ncbi:transcriptional regulator with XRE-family HTH domain [Bradyrhizobium sp. cir1]|uniref:helix-turn-helix domain-containing protein n=1 Tax=Bradyrhizobium sp. cir1 TaxID=1445730 RepID=UPI001605DDAB|nr:helix-turn-helix transcriptional regulator [Bradyrhizobium sp. cir1]MBB4374430.1 transcriptional regulator with XRE-family HTH domain [Bradyrhizobium sp. cir1]